MSSVPISAFMASRASSQARLLLSSATLSWSNDSCFCNSARHFFKLASFLLLEFCISIASARSLLSVFFSASFTLNCCSACALDFIACSFSLTLFAMLFTISRTSWCLPSARFFTIFNPSVKPLSILRFVLLTLSRS